MEDFKLHGKKELRFELARRIGEMVAQERDSQQSLQRGLDTSTLRPIFLQLVSEIERDSRQLPKMEIVPG